MMKSVGDYILRLLPVFLLTCGVAFAQTSVPFPGGVERREDKSDLPERARTAAEDYLEVLDQLQMKITDYVEYFADLKDGDRDEVLKELHQLSTELQSGEYSSSCSYLLTDLSQLLADLKTQEKSLKHSQRVDEQKARKLIMGLRLELTALNQLLSEEIAQELQECSAHREAIAAYLEAALKSKELARKSRGSAYVIKIESLPPVPGVPSVRPVAPVAPAGMSGSKRSLNKSIQVGGTPRPVVISSQAGDVIITGAFTDAIAARLDIEVSAVSREKEKAFANGAGLSVEEADGAYDVTVTLPELADPNTRLLVCRLTIEMPEHFPVECQNSFGNVILTNLKGDVTVGGDHSSVNLSDLTGRIDVTNNLGPVAMASVVADAVINNSYASISVINSTGDLELNNQYGPVTLLNSTGDVQLINSGPVTVRDHTGDVRIDNSNGLVEIAGVDGDVWAFNSYRPLVVSGISGAVRLENANASIRVADVSGQMDVSNRFGSIDITSFGGPIEINNESGPVTLRPSDWLQGNSTVNASDGVISLFVTDASDFQVDIGTLDGTIITSLPLQREREGDLETGTMTLGKGSGKLSLTGVGGSVVVKKE